MKIMIEIDGQPLESATSVVAPPSSTATVVAVEDGGAGPAAFSSAVTQSDTTEDAGAPPPWLVEAVNRAIEEQGDAPQLSGFVEDGGSGPSG